jgi:hypothetical protein
VTNANCASCGRAIDGAAKLCPYCGADPATGERVVDTQAILQEVFHPREVSTSESVMEFARQRQGIVVVVSLLVAFLLLAAIHQFVTRRNANAVTDAPAVPLTEITDVANQARAATPVPMPALDFPFEGRPQMMRTFIVERGAVAPAPPPPAAGGAAGFSPPNPAQPGGLKPAAPPAAAPRAGVPPAAPPQRPPARG